LSIEIKDITSCKRNLIVELPAETLDKEIHELAEKYAQRVQVPGFRRGKVPLSIIKQRFSAELRNDATQEVVQRSWKTAVEEHQLQPLDEPKLEHMDSQPGSPLKFTVSFEVLPPIEIKNYTGVRVDIQTPVVEDADVEKTIAALREQSALIVPVEGEPVRDGHLVTLRVDYELEGAGKPIHEDDVVLVVGEDTAEKSFSENLLGAKSGEERSFEIRYPEDYHQKAFAGKLVRYTVQIKEIKEKQLPELNDEFAKDVAGHENLADLRTKIRKDLETRAELEANEKTKEQVLDQIVQSHAFEVPHCLVQTELENRARRVARSLAKQGVDLQKAAVDWDKIFEAERPRAEQAVRRMLVMDAIARQERLEVTENELDEEFRRLADERGKSSTALRVQFEKDKRIQGFKEHLLHKKALDFIVRNANITRRL
jgi:trigger factor